MAAAGTPKYQVIAERLRRQILDGDLAPGHRFPAQAALARDHGVTVMTLRQALVELERDGLVRASRGRGTFVAERPSISFGLDRLSSFAQEMSSIGADVTTEVLRVDEPSNAHDAQLATEAASWEIDEGTVTIVRRRTIDGVPVVMQRSTVSRSTFRMLAEVDLTTTSLYDALRDRAGVAIDRATETFRAVLVGSADARALAVPARSAALASTRVSFEGDRPVVVDHALMVGSATQVRAERTVDDLRLGYVAT